MNNNSGNGKFVLIITTLAAICGILGITLFNKEGILQPVLYAFMQQGKNDPGNTIIPDSDKNVTSIPDTTNTSTPDDINTPTPKAINSPEPTNNSNVIDIGPDDGDGGKISEDENATKIEVVVNMMSDTDDETDRDKDADKSKSAKKKNKKQTEPPVTEKPAQAESEPGDDAQSSNTQINIASPGKIVLSSNDVGRKDSRIDISYISEDDDSPEGDDGTSENQDDASSEADDGTSEDQNDASSEVDDGTSENQDASSSENQNDMKSFDYSEIVNEEDDDKPICLFVVPGTYIFNFYNCNIEDIDFYYVSDSQSNIIPSRDPLKVDITRQNPSKDYTVKAERDFTPVIKFYSENAEYNENISLAISDSEGNLLQTIQLNQQNENGTNDIAGDFNFVGGQEYSLMIQAGTDQEISDIICCLEIGDYNSEE